MESTSCFLHEANPPFAYWLTYVITYLHPLIMWVKQYSFIV